MNEQEVPLSGGNASGLVVRVGDTVRKPWTGTTPGVLALMDSVRAAGVDVPLASGPDEQGRLVVEFVPGTIALDGPPLDLDQLARVGRMVRGIHDASPGVPEVKNDWDVLIPTTDPDLICHNDLTPWNLIVGDRWVFIDWDAAGPSTRLWDLAYSAQAFTLSDLDRSPTDSAQRLRAFVDGYGAGQELRAALPSTMAARARAMHDLLRDGHATGREPWGTMYVEGHGDHWLRATHYAEQHRDVWAEALNVSA